MSMEVVCQEELKQSCEKTQPSSEFSGYTEYLQVFGVSTADSKNNLKGSIEVNTDDSYQTQFLDLPPVLISEIFNHLNAKELSIISCVCVPFWKLSSDSHGWKNFYCERWGLPIAPKSSEPSKAIVPEKSWRQLYVEREARSKAFIGRFKIDVLHGHTEPIRSVSLLPSANLIFTAGYDTVIRMWDMEEGFLIEQSRSLGSTIRAIAVDTDMLIVGGTGAFVLGWKAIPTLPHLFDLSGVSGHSKEFCLRGHEGPVTSLGLDSSKIYSSSWDMSVRVWDRCSLKCLKILRHGDWIWSMVIRGSNLFSAAGSDLYTWDIDSGDLLRVRVDVHKGNAYAIQANRSGHLLFSGGEDGAIHMFENKSACHHARSHAKSNKPIASWIPHTSPVYSLAFEDPWLVSASGDGRLAMMDVRKLLKFSSNNVSERVVVDNGNHWHKSTVVSLQNVEPPQRMLHGFYKNLYSVDIGAERVVCGGEEGVVRIWDFSQALEIARRVQASKSARLEKRTRRKRSDFTVHAELDPDDQFSFVTTSCDTHGNKDRIWQRQCDSSEVQA